jgi:hypothetical protein
MIGVIAEPADHDVVREFFELFKTRWEFYRGDGQYDVLLCAGDGQFEANAKLTLFYAGRKTPFDDQQKIQTRQQRRRACIVSYLGNRIPIYGNTITFPEKGCGLLKEENSPECVAYRDDTRGAVLARIGYDLFSEVRTLLTFGQPPANASMPTLELHIAFLRDLITGCGVPLVEIPPVPYGYRFIACLTHDVDHPSIRQHRWDHTMFGFLYRAIFGSLRNLVRGRMPIKNLLINWAAALKLPFVYLRLAKDFWRDFDDRYLELEKDLRSTFFVIPFRNCWGRKSHGPAPMIRATRYEAREIADTIGKLMTAGCEVGLHGIDAWFDSSRGSEELEEIRRLTGISEVGVRMHWLYYDQQSHTSLETAGATYDSTIGYNETVGYRAGTTQVYKPLEASRLLELPLHIMDTAMFYPSYLHLSPRHARTLLGKMVDNAVQLGGTLTINWHDRSLAPERLWGECYRDLIQELKSRGAWFATAYEAVSWFRKRRSVEFEEDPICPNSMRARIPSSYGDGQPGLRMRIYKEQNPGEIGSCRSEAYVDIVVPEGTESQISLNVSR